jgi:hypothetical protein
MKWNFRAAVEAGHLCITSEVIKNYACKTAKTEDEYEWKEDCFSLRHS